MRDVNVLCNAYLCAAGVVLIVDGQRFASKSKARKLAQAAAPAPSETSCSESCPAGPYIVSGTTNQSIFDQLTIAEYNDVIDFMVIACRAAPANESRLGNSALSVHWQKECAHPSACLAASLAMALHTAVLAVTFTQAGRHPVTVQLSKRLLVA